ncbi:MAG: RNHCP domain-containing protein [Phycisphaeraceae bacterium]|nr:RNHCP domain-containing protein [Phycisphaeraceae bacterium]
MARSQENAGFACAHCGRKVQPLTNGSYRNHCPWCLYSLHVDHEPGDRTATCHGLMEPVGFKLSPKGWQVIHRCLRCGAVKSNRLALDDAQPDSIDVITRIMRTRQGPPR